MTGNSKRWATPASLNRTTASPPAVCAGACEVEKTDKARASAGTFEIAPANLVYPQPSPDAAEGAYAGAFSISGWMIDRAGKKMQIAFTGSFQAAAP